MLLRKNKGEHSSLARLRSGFTLLELLLASSIMLIVILGAFSLYTKSNRVSVDQQQFAELQHDVRSSMFFISRDIRSTGVGISTEIAGYFLEGRDGLGPSPDSSDSIKIMGNFEDPLNLRIQQYQEGGGVDTAYLYDSELEKNSYGCPDYYENRTYLIISTKNPGCFTFRFIPDNSVSKCKGEAELSFQPGKCELNPPGGLIDTGCAANCWDDGIITIAQVKQYWLDTTGNPGDYPDLNLTKGQDGYLGIPNTLYLTTTNEIGDIIHLPLAKNIENLQFQYSGDFDQDGFLDGFSDWDNANWTINPSDDQTTKQTKLERISQIRQVRLWILGKTRDLFVSVSGTPSTNIHLYRRPAIANVPAGSQDDRHRRFLLESTANIRNLSLNIYNTGAR
jgi:prepilin-type N-terminal cleavage/methylation domain-containing protein